MNKHPGEFPRSDYYPPRARWCSRLWYPWHHLRQISFLRRIPPLTDLPAEQFLLSCLVPGYVLRFYNYRRTSNAVMASFFALLLLFFVAFGHLVANLAFGLMISAHATCLSMLLQRWIQPEGLRGRILLSVLSLLIVSGLIYLPLREGMLARFLPLDTGHGVVLVRCEAKPRPALRDESVAFSMEYQNLDHGVYQSDGFGIERVLGVAGDHVEFLPEFFSVNGRPSATLPNMPTKGQLVIPQNCFFVWPKFDISNPGRAGFDLSAVLLRITVISQDKIIGRPCQRWFGIRQPVP